MRLLFIGDIVGTPGINMVKRAVPILRQREKLDYIIANAENASNGAGIYPSSYKGLKDAGIDAFTMGDHIYKRIEILGLMEKGEPICKPANFPDAAPGKNYHLGLINQDASIAVISLMGRTYMRPVDCPFTAIDRVLAQLPSHVRIIFVDVHAEATADKYLLGHYLKGRVSAVVGTHTHVPTADERIFPEGTAFLCDVGMTGSYAGILGRKVSKVLPVSLDFVPQAFEIESEDPRLGGVIIDIDDATGKATAIRRVLVTPDDLG